MKTELTIEQSKRLTELGVSVDKASDRSMPGAAVFTLDDLLAILPKWIKYRNKLLWLKIWINEWSEQWCAEYNSSDDMDDADTFQSSEELVDCLALLLEGLITDKLITT